MAAGDQAPGDHPERGREELIAAIRDDQRAWALAMVRVRLEQMLESRIPAGQLHALVVLHVLGPLPASELARRLAISGPSLSGLLDRLERSGLVEREVGPETAAGGSRG